MIISFMLTGIIQGRKSLWKKVKIEASIMLQTANLPYEALDRHSPDMIHELIQTCEAYPTCNTVCEISDKQFNISFGFISPLYQPSDPSADTLTCYTQLEKDLVYGKNIVGSSHLGSAKQKISNLALGYWNGDYFKCMNQRKASATKWLTVDFEKVERFQTIKLTNLYYENSSLFYLKKGEIYVGNETVTDGDFSAYKLLDSYPDNDDYGTTMTIQLKTPAYGRYLGLLHTSTHEIFYLCYFQVY